jgi:hypothetical protein
MTQTEFYEKWKKTHPKPEKLPDPPATTLTPTDRTRLNAQSQKILERLRQGPVMNVELAGIALKYTSRISDLRKLGHTIACTRIGGGATLYTLRT